MPQLTNENLSGQTVTIHRLKDLANADVLRPGIDAVFFDSSSTKTFDSEDARRAFRERWLGRFIKHDPEWVYVAVTETQPDCAGPDDVVGYLAGALDDPALSARFSDLGYFQDFKAHTRDFPAQLHVNLTATMRGRGHGKQLIEAFVHDLKPRGVPGVHVVTGADARNVAFYTRAGFEERARTDWNNHEVIFLGRKV